MNTGVFKIAAIVPLYQSCTPLRNDQLRIDKRTFRTPNLGNRLRYGLLKHLASRVHFLFFNKNHFQIFENPFSEIQNAQRLNG
jgi:hypothetical protein